MQINQRNFWNMIKPYINSHKSKHNARIVLKDNERIIRDQREVAETLKDFFTSFGHTEQRSSPDLSHIQQNLTPKPPLSVKKTNPVEVKRSDVES